MLNECSSLTSLNLFNFNNNNIKDMSYMFNKCTSLTFLNLFNLNIILKIIIKDMSYMFNEYTSLIYLNLFNFNNNNAKDMSICLMNVLL